MEIPDEKDIRRRRMDLGVSQKEMAKECGISVPALNQYEKGKQALSHEKWVILVKTIDRLESEKISIQRKH